MISIIVPVYNAETYLHRCVDSILSQLFAEFELLLIDDGSTDKSGSICNEYAALDSRVRVLHQQNGGPSKARNAGIALALGDYLMFSDSDDFLEPNWCDVLYRSAVEHPHAMPISGAKLVYVNETPSREVIRVFDHALLYDHTEYVEAYKRGLSGGLWCKIFKKDIILKNGLLFDESVRRGEDLLFVLEYMSHMHAFVSVPTVAYNYMQQDENSLLNRYCPELDSVNAAVYNAWMSYYLRISTDLEPRRVFASNYYSTFISILRNTFDERNKQGLLTKLKHNQRIINSREFIECMELADTSKEDPRYIKLLLSRNYYLVWFFEQAVIFRNYFRR